MFSSTGLETAKKYTEESLKALLDELGNEEKYGAVLRCKGFLDSTEGDWFYFDYVPGESDIRRGSAQVTGRICVIGSHINEEAIEALLKA